VVYCNNGLVSLGDLLVSQHLKSQSFVIHSSQFLKHLILSAYALAAISVMALPWSLLIRILFVGLILLGLVYQLKQLAQPKFIALKRVDQQWFLINREGQSISVALNGATLVMPRMIMLNGVSAEGSRQSLLLMSDSLEKQAFRRLRVLLRWGN